MNLAFLTLGEKTPRDHALTRRTNKVTTYTSYEYGLFNLGGKTHVTRAHEENKQSHEVHRTGLN